MDIKIKTTGKSIETVNCILGHATEELMRNGNIAQNMGLTAKDVVIAEQFRKRLLMEYFKLIEKDGKRKRK